jgi:glycosyltransferase involved in cell wall biosynthesis
MAVKVLSIGSDRKLFEEGSAVSARIKDYGSLVGELHIVVFALKSLNLKERQLSANVWVYPTNSVSRWFYVRDAARMGKAIVFGKKFVRGESLVTTQDPFESGLAGLKVKKKWRLPLEVQLHTDPNSPYFSGFLNRIRKIIAKRVLAHADSVRDVKTLPIYVDKEKITNARISFDLHARFKWRFILLTVSRLSPEKNLGFVLRVLKGVLFKFPDTGLVVVGSGPEEENLKSFARKLGIEKNVAFVGWQEDLASYYKTANLFIQTSRFEGYGLSLIEAGLSGLPVITTPVGLAQELEHGKDAYIYPLGNLELFVEGVKDLIKNNHKRENLKMNLKRTLETKLLSKADYMAQIKANWEETASKIK